jgi:integrase
MRLTDAIAATLQLPPGKADALFWDDAVPGFGIRIRASGVRTWVFQYKAGGYATRRLTIGRLGAVRAARAREIAGEYHAQVRLGRNPSAEKRAAVERSRDTFGALARLYLERRGVGLRANTIRSKTRALLKYAAPLHSMSIDAVDQRAVARLLTQVEGSSGAVTANRLRANMSAMYTWALKEGIAAGNPVVNTYKREERPRDRVLTGKELALIWQLLPDGNYGDIVKLLILTGQRANEIARLKWSEIESRQIVLSRERTKNDRAHTVPLGPTAISILKLQTPRIGTDFVFGGRREAAFADWFHAKRALDARLAEHNGALLPHWVIHDIRRSVATGMADIGVQPHVIEAVLNHVSGHKGGIAGIYNRAQYSAEKAQALARWDEHIAALLRGRRSNVSALRQEGVK